jgi:hypothetical protein
MTLAKKLLRKVGRRPWALARRVTAKRDLPLEALAAHYDVIIMKHCYPASDILADTGRPDPASPRQSQENYRAVYRLLRDKLAGHPDRLFIIWTLPPRHRLYQPPEGDRAGNAARATAFSRWLAGEFLTEGGGRPNIRVWDFRGIVTDPATDYLKYEYELSHEGPDSHPNGLANDAAGPGLARFIVEAAAAFNGIDKRRQVKIMLLHRSTGGNVYRYPARGLPGWFKDHRTAGGMSFSISHRWFPADGNMPVHYYRSWLGA